MILEKEQRQLLGMNLQLLADGGTGDDSNGGDGGDNGGEQKTYTLEDVQKMIQSESDKRVTQALKTAEEKFEEKFNERLSKEKELSKLSEEEKTKKLLEDKEKELTAKENLLKQKELLNQAKDIFSERNLPVTMAEKFLGKDAEETLKNIDAFQTLWNNELEKAVTTRVKSNGKTPGSSTKTTNNEDAFLMGLKL